MFHVLLTRIAVCFLTFLVWVVDSPQALAQTTGNKPGHWIMHPFANPHAYGVFHFRKTVDLTAVPEQLIIHISADERYRFYVNEKSVSIGPARSDVKHWRYETIDIAPFLHKGKNILAAVVWNEGENSAWAQLSYQTGFWISAENKDMSVVNTDSSWKVTENMAYAPLADIAHITGPYEQVYGQRYPWGWQNINYNDQAWLVPKISEIIQVAAANNTVTSKLPTRQLIERNIPLPEEKLQRIPSIRRSRGLADVPDNFLKGTGRLDVPAWGDVTILIDQTFLTTAYLELLVSGGRGAKITVTYAESLADEKGTKGNRDEIEHKKISGHEDVFMPDGGEKRLFRTLYYRTFRYIQLHIENHQEALQVNDLYGVFTAYPLQENAAFKTNDTTLTKIWNTGWRTARLCAFETYMDCPYYEQLQYVGDTRIQALISLYVSGDDRLMRNAIEQMDYSRIPEGITQSRYPSNNRQVIPPFSLFWISMIHDYWMHKTDDAFIRSFLPSIQSILAWHHQYINEKGMLGKCHTGILLTGQTNGHGKVAKK
jgi:hypothetical protein